MIRTLAIGLAVLLTLCGCGAAHAQPAPARAASAQAVAPGASGGDAALPRSRLWTPGTNFTVLSPAEPTGAPAGKVQVLEVFWLGCPVCYAFEPYVRAWRKNLPAYVQFVRVPVMWDSLREAHARLFYTLEALGRDDLIAAAFDTLHRLQQQQGTETVMFSKIPGQNLALQEAFAERHGITAAAFAAAYHSFDVQLQLQKAKQIMHTYEVDSTPTLIVDGRYRTGPPQAGGFPQLISLISFLAKWDHDHPH